MIYLDYNATTPIDKEVAEAMIPYLHGYFGNPSSIHKMGIEAKNVIEKARRQVADLLNAEIDEIVFTSGGSESNNTVLKGVAHTFKDKGNHIITSQIEHPAILKPCRYLEKLGYDVSYVKVDESGLVNPFDIDKLIKENTILVSIMHSNNETGSIQPIKEIADICRRGGVLFHTDASQSIGKVPIDVKELDVDFLTIAGHKLYGPKGIGALYIKSGINIEPLIHGAGHEKGRRAGTENIILEVGLGKACEIAESNLGNNEVKENTDYFHNRLIKEFGRVIHLNGHLDKRLPNTLNISFVGYNGYEILERLDIALASTGSACHSGITTISPVLKAMGVSDDIGRGAVRFSLGKYTTKNDIDIVVERLKDIIK